MLFFNLDDLKPIFGFNNVADLTSAETESGILNLLYHSTSRKESEVTTFLRCGAIRVLYRQFIEFLSALCLLKCFLSLFFQRCDLGCILPFSRDQNLTYPDLLRPIEFL